MCIDTRKDTLCCCVLQRSTERLLNIQFILTDFGGDSFLILKIKQWDKWKSVYEIILKAKVTSKLKARGKVKHAFEQTGTLSRSLSQFT